VKHFQAIAAMSLNRVIGHGNKIPWHLPEDFKWFKKMTLGNIVVMGRKTFEGIGKALPNRKNLILTQHPRRFINSHPEIFCHYKEWRGGRGLKRAYQLTFSKIEAGEKTDLLIFNSLHKLDPSDFPQKIFICGGAQIYEQALALCSDLYLTLVKKEVEGDAFFPTFEDKFVPIEEILDCAEFKIIHYRHRGMTKD
jgi:dihydrofolate reductase